MTTSKPITDRVVWGAKIKFDSIADAKRARDYWERQIPRLTYGRQKESALNRIAVIDSWINELYTGGKDDE